MKTLKRYCHHDCMNGDKELVAECTTKDCPNWPYRFGRNEARKGFVSIKSLTALLKYQKMALEPREKAQESIFLGQGIGRYCLEVKKPKKCPQEKRSEARILWAFLRWDY